MGQEVNLQNRKVGKRFIRGRSFLYYFGEVMGSIEKNPRANLWDRYLIFFQEAVKPGAG
jgi:hypothetical protein